MWSSKKATVVWGVILGLVFGLFCFDAALAAPVITFAPRDTVIPVNSSTTLDWTVTDAVSCTASGGWSGAKDSSSGSEGTGNLTVGLKSFTLTCQDSIAGESSVSVNITVADPPTLSFTPVSSEIEYNTPARLVWSTTNASSCEKYGDWTGVAGLTGNELTENLLSEKTFGMRCVGDGGIVDKSIIISISNPALQVELNFAADDGFIEWDAKDWLRWSATNADSCVASGAWVGARDKDSGSYQTPNLKNNTTYSLFCSNAFGSSVRKNITIIVESRERRPVETIATAVDNNIEYNTKATINWTSTNADRCRVYYGSWTGNLPANGSYTSANLITDKTFTVRCYSWSDTGDSVVVINVAANPALPPTLDFSADETALEYNNSTELDWSVTGTNTLNASGAWSGGKSMPSGSEATGNLITDKSYTLVATGDGGSVREDVVVNVDDPTFPPNVSLAADDTPLEYNGATVIRWSSEHADWCRLRKYNAAMDLVANDSVGSDGNRFTGNLIDNTSYSFECGNEDSTATDAVAISVVPVGFPPEITLTADTNPVQYGEGTTIRWTTTNAAVCNLTGVGNVAINGSRGTGNLILPKTYVLTCVGDGGVSDESITIRIAGTPEQPPELTFWADEYAFYGNGSTTLRWEAVNADRCWASRGPWSGDKSRPSGSEATTNLTTTTTYEISCNNVNGTVSRSLIITVDTANAVDMEFYADHMEIQRNGSVTLTWNGKNANWCEAYGPTVGWGDWGRGGYTRKVADVEASETVGPFTAYNTLVYLRCWNYTSNSNWQSLNIVAGEHPPSITMSAPSPVAYNSPATLSWFADYSDSCVAWSNPEEPTWSGSKTVSGLQMTSNLTQNTTFYLECENSDNDPVRIGRTVTVGAINDAAPQINFTSDKYIAIEAEEYTLNWNVSGATWCEANSNPVGLWSGAKSSAVGSETLNFSGDGQELVLTCGSGGRWWWQRGASTTAIVKIDKGGTEMNVPSVSFWSDNASLPVGGRTMLRWRVENAESCVASNGWTGARAAGSGQERTALLFATTRFELSCTNVAGSRTVILDVVVGGAPPEVIISFIASKYDVSAGDSTTLSWTAENASECYAIDSTGKFVGWKATSGSATIIPDISTTYQLVCSNSGGTWTSAVPIVVAKVIVCPDPARIINLGNTVQLTAWFKRDADIGFSCSNTSGAVNITNGYDGFPTEWRTENGAVITINGTGLATGLDYTEVHGGPIRIIAEYKEAIGSSRVHVVPPPVTCWKCTEARTCSSEITFPVDGTCSDGYHDSMRECAKSCRKPVDWQEAGS